MFLKNILIKNFKSLRDIDLDLEPINVLVGPNGSGKTNFAEALRFLQTVYSQGLSMAVGNFGGIENIFYRKSRRSRSPIEFTIRCEPVTKKGGWPPGPPVTSYEHWFCLRAKGQSISADYTVEDERVIVDWGDDRPELIRNKNEIWTPDKSGKTDEFFGKNLIEFLKSNITGNELMLAPPFFLGRPMSGFFQFFTNWNVIRLHAEGVRRSSAPKPSPSLSLWGENLPTIVQWMQTDEKEAWRRVLAMMQQVVPTLEEISVDYSATKKLRLYFKEQSIARPWPVEDVSDGTLQSLAIFVSIYNPRTSLVVIEEPENAVHPWIIRKIVEALRSLSKQKTVFLTTHSPVLVDQLRPSELLIVSKGDDGTQIDRMTDLVPTIESEFNEGEIGLSEYLDAGFIPRAVPGGAL